MALRLAVATTLVLAVSLTVPGCDRAGGPVEPAPEDDTPPVPTVELIGPAYQVVGNPDAQVTVRGYGFRETSVIRWNGTALPTVGDGTPFGTLTARIPQAALDAPQDVTITVYTPASSDSGVSSLPRAYSVRFAVPRPCGDFDPAFGAVGSETMEIRCRSWGLAPETEVFFDSHPIESETLDFHTLRFTAPAELLTERAQRTVRIRNPGREGPGWSEGATFPVIQPVVVGSGGNQIGAGCLIDVDGVLQCWDTGPRPVAEHLRFREIHSSPNGDNTCAESTDGEIYCWGYNSFGQLGAGSETSGRTSEPTIPVAGGADLNGLTVGRHHACALDPDGRAWCWGSNGGGRLGTDQELKACGSQPCASLPVPVAGDLRYARIAAGAGHTCALTTEGVPYCWGEDRDGVLGNGSGQLDSPVPHPVLTDLAFVAIAAGYGHSCALTATGTAHCWGANSYSGRLGVGDDDDREVPTPVLGDVTFAALSLGIYHTCGITVEGASYCWGKRGDGQLGTDDEPNTRPGRVSGDWLWSEISAAWDFTCGLTTTSGFYCWGRAYEPPPFDLAHGPAVCGLHGGHYIHWCYPSPAPVLGVVGQASGSLP